MNVDYINGGNTWRMLYMSFVSVVTYLLSDFRRGNLVRPFPTFRAEGGSVRVLPPIRAANG